MIRILVLATQAALGVAMVAASLVLSGCSSMVPVAATTPITISCTWQGQDGGTITDNDCYIDRSSASAEPTTTGNQTDATVDAEADIPVDVTP